MTDLNETSYSNYAARGYPTVKGKGNSNPITGLDRPWGFQEVEAPRFQDSRHMKTVILSALRTGHIYPRRKYTCYSLLLEAESKPGQ